MADTHTNHPIMLFDGDCAMCNGAVHFVLDHEKEPVLRFAALQSDVGQSYLKQFGLPTATFSSYIIVEGDQHYTQSRAVRRMTHHMGGVWRHIGKSTALVPASLADWLYDLGFRNRYKLFGKVNSCRLLPPEVTQRFLSQ